MRDFSLPPPSSRELRSSGMLYSVITHKSAILIPDDTVKLPIQKNSFNPTSNNLGILILWYLRTAVSRLQVLLFTRKKLHE
jgi:hypothetical protein